MRRSVCPFVGLWVIRSVHFKCVCVFFWARAVYWTAYVIPRCHGEGPPPDSTPPCRLPFIRNFMHAFGHAWWQCVSISSSEQKLLARLQIGRLGLSLQLSWMTIFCFLKAFWKLSFLYFVIMKCWRAAGWCKNFWKRYSFVFIYSQPVPVVVNRNTYEVWGRPCFLPYRLLITEGRREVGGGVRRGLSAERKRVNHVCNRTGFPLKWETEVGSVQIYGAP